MAKQQPQQPYFIPRVAGVPQPPPQFQPQPQPQPHGQLETPADEEQVFAPQPLPPLEPPMAAPAPFVGRTPFPVPQKSGGGIFRTLAVVLLVGVIIALVVLVLPVFRKNPEPTAPPKEVDVAQSVATPPSTATSSATRKAESSPQSPPVHPEGATRVEDKEFGFSFAALEGYMAASETEPVARHSYKRKFMTEPTRIIEIREFEGDFSRHLAAADNFPPPLPGQTSESAVFDWRGRKVGGTRSVDSKRNPSYLTLNIVIPLRKHPIVVTVGGAEEYEPVLQEVVDQVLGSLSEAPGT